MNDENMNDNNEKGQSDNGGFEESNENPDKRKRNIFLTVGIVGGLFVLIFGVWFFWRGEGGKAVPAPRSVSFNEEEQQSAPPEGRLITLEPEQADRIGIKLETVGETISDEAMTVASTGEIRPNAYNETPVFSFVGGVVRKMGVELGDNVQKGQPLAVVFSDEFAAAQANYLALQIEARVARQNYDRAAQLMKLNPVNRAELDQVMAKRASDAASLEESKLRYQRTVKLVEIGASSREELERDQAKLRSTEAEVDQSVKQFERSTELVSINPVSSNEFEIAAVRLTTAESELARAGQRLELLGLPRQRIDLLKSALLINSEVGLPSPVSGTITSRSVNLGEIIEANKELIRVTNLDTVWVIAQVYENDLPQMRVGSGASVTTEAYPERLFRGHVTYIDPGVDPRTRTAQVRVELENPGHILKIGMYVNINFGSSGSGEKTMPVVPASAVQNMSGRQFVFLATEKPNVFLMKPVRLGTEKNGQQIVFEGINVGEKIVTDGSFLLRAEFVKQNPGAQ